MKPISIFPHTFAAQTFSGDVGVLKGITTGSAGLADLTGTIHWGDGTTSSATLRRRQRLTHRRSRLPHRHTPPPAITTCRQRRCHAGPLRQWETLDALSPASPDHRIRSAGFDARKTRLHHHRRPADPWPPSPAPRSRPQWPPSPPSARRPPLASLGIATIFWGDGSHSAGTITTGTSNQPTVTATHVYKKAGKHTVWVSVTAQVAARSLTYREGAKKLLAYIKTSRDRDVRINLNHPPSSACLCALIPASTSRRFCVYYSPAASAQRIMSGAEPPA